MELIKLIVGLWLIGLGMWGATNPKNYMALENWWAHFIGMKLTPSNRTYKFFKAFGILLVFCGILIIVS